MDTTLAATDRTHAVGKGNARKCRRAGKLPVVLYGLDKPAVALAVDPTALANIYRITGNRNTVVRLQVPGEGEVPCLAREVQRHPVSRAILHVDFLRVSADRPVQVTVPVRPVGRALGESIGGRVAVIRRHLGIRCTYENIPEAIEVDVTAMNVGDIRSIGDIAAPPGAAFLAAGDVSVVTVYGKRSEVVEPGAEGAAEAEAEAEAEDDAAGDDE